MYCTKSTNDITFLSISCEREALKVFSDFTTKARSSIVHLQLALLAKMATSGPKRDFCVLTFDKSKCATDVQWKFWTAYGKEAPSRKAIYDWHNKFVTMGYLCLWKRSGRPVASEESVQQVRETFRRSLKKSVRRASRELLMPVMTAWKVVRKKLSMKPYKIHLLHMLKEDNNGKQLQFCCQL
jgi:hypothetical protein